MSKILKNNTANPVSISDVGQTVPASSQITIASQDYLLYAASDDVVTLVGNSTLTVNDGSNDLSISDGIDLIKGIFPTTVAINSSNNSPAIVSLPETNFDQQGRLRVSDHKTIFEITGGTPFDTTRYWAVTTAGSGSQAAAANDEPARVLSTTTASGDRCNIQTYRRVEYNKGHSQLILMTAAFDTPKANLTQRVGYYCNLHGLFFQAKGTTFQVVRRESVSTGSAIDNEVDQDSWNVDTLDGSGDANNPSGIEFDPTKATVYGIDFLWLGVKSVRFYVGIGEDLVLVHKMEFSNLLDDVYMDSGMAPIRAEILNTGTVASSSSLKFICSSVKSEGSDVNIGVVRVVDTGTSAVSINTNPKVVAGIRLNYTDYVNGSIKPIHFSLIPTSGNNFAYYQVIVGASLTSPTWTANSEGIADVLTNNPSYSGGSVLESGFIQLRNKNKTVTNLNAEVDSDVYLGRDCDGNEISLILVVETVSGTGNVLFSGSYREYR